MAEEKIKLEGLDKADVLVVLYNSSKPQGMGFMHYDPKPMTREEAQNIIEEGLAHCREHGLDEKRAYYFDYLKGRVMKVDLSGDELSPGGYDRDNGQGAAERAISALRATNETNPQVVRDAHRSNTQNAARDVERNLHEQSRYEHREGMGVLHLGLDDVADVLGPKVKKGVKKLDDLKK